MCERETETERECVCVSHACGMHVWRLGTTP